MKPYHIALFVFIASCAGWQRDCTSCSAENFGADWIVVQQRMTDGKPYNCWLLKNAVVTNEGNSDGIYWTEEGGHLVHLAGQYARVQVVNSRFKDAAKLIGVDADLCRGGAYPAEGAKKEE